MKISGWPLGTAPASCMVMKSCDFNRHQQTCPNMEWAKVSIQCGSSGKSIFSNIFYENMNIFKENHWSVKIMYFQVISYRKICILKGLPKVFIENIFLHITSRIHLLSVLSVIIWSYDVGWAYLICIQSRQWLLCQLLLSKNFPLFFVWYHIGVFTLGPVAFSMKNW